MRKVMFALCFMFGGVVTLTAQDTTSNQYRNENPSQYPQDMQQQQQDQYQQQDRERIQSTELPDEVKRTLEGAEYRGWLISGAFKANASDDQSMQTPGETDPTNPSADPANPSVDPTSPDTEPGNQALGAEGEEVYIVELKNGAETKTIKFDAKGQQLEVMDDMNQNGQFNQGQNQHDHPQDPNEEAEQTDPGSTIDQTEQNQPDQSTETRPEIQTPESSQSPSPDQSTETQSSQSGQTDQSRANEPK